MDDIMIVEMIVSLILGLIFGFATAAVREKKGYGRNWFWFGFFCGMVPLIIACAIPEKQDPYATYIPGGLERAMEQNTYSEPQQSVFTDEEFVKKTIGEGGWQCACGRANPGYVSTCSCGRNKRGNDASGQGYAAKAAARAQQQKSLDAELKKLAMLLDAQVITQQEYESGVRELLGKK